MWPWPTAWPMRCSGAPSLGRPRGGEHGAGRGALQRAWGDTQLKVHLARLVELEYLVVHRGERGGFSYELAWDGAGRDGAAFLVGLLDPAALDAATAYDPGRSGPGRPPVGGWSGGGRGGPEGAGRRPCGPSCGQPFLD